MHKLRKTVIAISIAVPVVIMLVITICYAIIEPYHRFILAPESAPQTRVGLVLGAGITRNGKPFKELQARLDSAADALNKGTVDRLILSGDNRYTYHNEPMAMKNYLVDTRHISVTKLQTDFAGRSTFESCERASKIFQVKKLIIFSAGTHLPRAIYLCRHFGIESYGISSGVEADNATRRELLARVKAVYNTKLDPEPTILGPVIHLK